MSYRKLLIVDDDPGVREMLSSVLKTSESIIFEAADGDEALEVAGKQGVFDVVITDIQMPGIDGIELAHLLEKRRNARNFLFMSGSTALDTIDLKLAEFESAAFVAKPFAITELLRVVHDLCETSHAETCSGQPMGESIPG